MGVPADVKVAVEMRLADMDKICKVPEKKPASILARLKS